MKPAECPAAADLGRLARGLSNANDLEQWGEHLADCPRCAAAFEAIACDDTLLVTLREQPVLANKRDPDLSRLISRLHDLNHRRLRTSGVGQTQDNQCGAEDTPIASGPEPLEFLNPPLLSDEIGRVGDYRVLEVIGHGGMGIVLRAEDVRLNRMVAIKLIRESRSLDTHYLARFAHEGKSLARLQHPNIVRVYEVGQHRNRPYLVLEYFAGGTLADHIAGRPQPLDSAAHWIISLALAVHYAHEQGIVHRDLKPGNILLDRRLPDGQGHDRPDPTTRPVPSPTADQLRIADFGLARQIDEPGVTQSGDLLGTPSYMAPELTRGVHGAELEKHLVDVYSLGAILYELITGRPPFRGATAPDTIDQVRHLEPVSLVRLRPGVPRELETICLKCLAKDPRRRYASAAELAEDLARFLDGRPILARPAGWFERIGKWARRRPAVAALVSVTIAAIASLATGGVVYERQLRIALGAAQASAVSARQSEALARKHRDRANADYRKARETLTGMLKIVEDRALADIPRLRDLQRRQLEQTLAFYVAAARRGGDDPEMRFDAASAALDAGRLQALLGQSEAALGSFREAAAGFESLARQFPNDQRFPLDWARALTHLATLSISRQDLDEAIRLGEQALGRLSGIDPAQNLERTSAEPDVIRSNLAATHKVLASAYFYARLTSAGSSPEEDWSRAERHYRQALGHCQALADEQPSDRRHRLNLARLQIDLSVLYQQRYDAHRDPCRQFHGLAEENLDRLIRQDPLDYMAICELALLRVNWAYVLSSEREIERALTDLSRNVNALRVVLEREPQMAQARDALYRSHGVRATILDAEQRYVESAVDWQAVAELCGEHERTKFRILRALALARTDRSAEAVAEAERLAAEPDVAASEPFRQSLVDIRDLAGETAKNGQF